ncbi:MAG TPA: efflux transporter outer membrane subunit [Woeseiaceae bacterium]|nr:efflux transporter outer membrane subunit [Woeseiaceae bacterium]
MTRIIVLLSATLGLGACAVGPEYRAPETAAPQFYNADAAHFAQTAIEKAWWHELGDPVLDDLIARALANDLDLRIAAARLREARAIFGDESLDRFPTVTAAGAYDRRKAQQPGFGEQPISTETYDLGFDAFWEIDLFGRVQSAVKAARADAEAAQANLHAAQVSVAAEVARNYLELLGAQRRYEVAIANRDNQNETVRLTRIRYELGRGTELDLASAEARLAAIEASLPPLIIAQRAARHRLAVLLGQPPGTLELAAGPDSEAISESFTNPLPIGEPASLLRRRPDIRAAERRLAAATARVGVATADLFPRLTVSGFIGFVTGDAGQIGESAAEAWSMTPVLSWAAFDLGSVRAWLRAAEAQADGALAFYKQTVLRALEETENAFVAYAQNQDRLAALLDQAAASRRAAELARIRYREGAIDFLRLLDAERTVLAAEDSVAIAQTELNTSVVAIYKALGGGWQAAPALAESR